MISCPTCRRRLEAAAEYCPYDGTAVPREIGVGTVLDGRYHLIGELGRGGMGVVYRAWQSDVERPVAIKVLHPYLAGEAELRARFRREAGVVERLGHAGIVELFDVGEHETGTPYLVMEYVPGEALDEVFADGTPVASRRALQLVRQVGEALCCAHDAGVIHRDLKLGNLLLVQEPGSPDRVKVVDFGIAKLVDIGTRESLFKLTQMGTVCGTPEYMAPEQATGETVDHRSDYYSLGVVLYRLVTGSTPYGRTGMAAALAHLEEPVPDARAVRPEIPQSVVDLIQRLMAKDPAERPRDGGELLELIDDSLAALDRRPSPEIVPEVYTGPELSVPADRHSSWGLAALLACLLAGGLGLFAALAPDGRSASVETSRAPARGLEPLLAGNVEMGPRRAVVSSAGGSSVRVLVPIEPTVGRRQTVLIDVWDQHGAPAGEPLSVSIAFPDGQRSGVRIRRTDMPGRYRLDRRFDALGQHQLVIEVGNVELAVGFEVIGDSVSS